MSVEVFCHFQILILLIVISYINSCANKQTVTYVCITKEKLYELPALMNKKCNQEKATTNCLLFGDREKLLSILYLISSNMQS